MTTTFRRRATFGLMGAMILLGLAAPCRADDHHHRHHFDRYYERNWSPYAGYHYRGRPAFHHVGPGPVFPTYVAPRVIVAPAPVIVTQPRLYVAPSPVYSGPPAVAVPPMF